jgi:non-ribosomal peptide synthetase component E (peptide arylation enzyme)
MAKPTRYTQDMIDDYLMKGFWRKESIADLWDKNASLIPQKEALVDSKGRVTWLQVKALSDNLALAFLRRDYKKDDVIHVILPNCIDSFIVRLACEKAGIVALTSLMTLREAELEYVIKTFEVKGIVLPWQFRNFDYYQAVTDLRSKLPGLKDIFVAGDQVPPGTHSIEEMKGEPETKEFPLSMLMKTRFTSTEVVTVGLTSGTTGLQKTAEHMPANRIATGTAYQRVIKLTGDDIVLNCINAVAGRGGAFCYSQPEIGAKTICLEIWNAEEALKLLQQEKATILFTAPAQLAMLVNHPNFDQYDHRSLRCAVCSTSPLEQVLIVEAEKKLGVPILNGYGSFDGGGVSGTAIDDDVETRRKTMGKPYPGVELRVVDDNGNEVPTGQEGELIYRGPLTTAGYYRDLPRTLEAWGTLGKEGWFHSGDIVKMDQNGNLVISGRKKDVIIRGGQNIYPIEIEELLVTHPKVDKAAVVAMPDPVMGEKTCAYVVLKGQEKLTFEEIKYFLMGLKIAPYKIPERLETIDEIPMENFKILKKVLRADVAKKLKEERR